MKPQTFVFFNVNVFVVTMIALAVFQFTGCRSTPNYEEIYAKQEEEKIQVYIFAGKHIDAHIYTDPLDIEIVNNSDYQYFSDKGDVNPHRGNKNPVSIFCLGFGTRGTAVFNLPKEINEFCVFASIEKVVFYPIARKYWTISPIILPINHQEKIQGYYLSYDNSKKLFFFTKIPADQIKNYYSKSNHYAHNSGSKTQPGFIKVKLKY
jgi:hypothetical protein